MDDNFISSLIIWIEESPSMLVSINTSSQVIHLKKINSTFNIVLKI